MLHCSFVLEVQLLTQLIYSTLLISLIFQGAIFVFGQKPATYDII